MSVRVSSICLNLPAVVAQHQQCSASIATSTDEGGFNEPSPEIKAKLKPSYTFDPADVSSAQADADAVDRANVYANTRTGDPAALHYVDFGYRNKPDGCEIRAACADPSATSAPSAGELSNGGENAAVEQHHYLTAAQVSRHSTDASNGFGEPKRSEPTVLYATIKPEVPSAADLFLELGGGGGDDGRAEYDVVTHSEERIYYSPQSVIVPRNAAVPVPRMAEPEPDDDEAVDAAGSDDAYDSMYGLEQVPPPRPPLPSTGPLSPEEDSFVEVGPATDAKEQLEQGDVMTADEEERLLSSR